VFAMKTRSTSVFLIGWFRPVVVGDSSIIFISNKFCLNLNGVPMWNIHHNWNKALCLNLNSIDRNIDIAR
jgi:hypothetical protein